MPAVTDAILFGIDHLIEETYKSLKAWTIGQAARRRGESAKALMIVPSALAKRTESPQTISWGREARRSLGTVAG
jgi:hypothetical protein